MSLLSKIISFIKADNLVKNKIERQIYSFLSLMFFCSICSYYFVRNMKDAFALDAAGSSNIISVLKLWFTFPASLLMFVVYSFLYKRYGVRNALKSVLYFFSAVFFAFSFFILPNMSPVDPLLVESFKSQFLGKIFTVQLFGLKLFDIPWGNFASTLAPVVFYTPICVYYVCAEVFGTVIVQIVFWQTVVTNLTVKQSIRIIPAVIFWGQIGTLIAGAIPLILNSTGFSKLIIGCISSAAAASLCLVMIYLFNLIEPCLIANKGGGTIAVKEKKEPNFFASIATVLKNRYLGFIALIVVSYGLNMGLIELCWKDILSFYCKTRGMSTVSFVSLNSFMLGLCGVVGTALLRPFLKNNGWRVSALITPCMLLLFGCIFFGLSIFSQELLFLSVVTGAAQNILTKVSKYALFDSTKEAAYVPLEADVKNIGKPAVELIGSRLGKALSGLAGILINAYAVRARNCLLQIACIILALTMLWIWAVNNLSKLYYEKYDQQSKLEQQSGFDRSQKNQDQVFKKDFKFVEQSLEDDDQDEHKNNYLEQELEQEED